MKTRPVTQLAVLLARANPPSKWQVCFEWSEPHVSRINHAGGDTAFRILCPHLRAHPTHLGEPGAARPGSDPPSSRPCPCNGHKHLPASSCSRKETRQILTGLKTSCFLLTTFNTFLSLRTEGCLKTGCSGPAVITGKGQPAALTLSSSAWVKMAGGETSHRFLLCVNTPCYRH